MSKKWRSCINLFAFPCTLYLTEQVENNKNLIFSQLYSDDLIAFPHIKYIFPGKYISIFFLNTFYCNRQNLMNCFRDTFTIFRFGAIPLLIAECSSHWIHINGYRRDVRLALCLSKRRVKIYQRSSQFARCQFGTNVTRDKIYQNTNYASSPHMSTTTTVCHIEGEFIFRVLCNFLFLNYVRVCENRKFSGGKSSGNIVFKKDVKYDLWT